MAKVFCRDDHSFFAPKERKEAEEEQRRKKQRRKEQRRKEQRITQSAQGAQRVRREEGNATKAGPGESRKRSSGDSARGWAGGEELACGGGGYAEFLELGTGGSFFFSARVAANDFAQFADAGSFLA
jgi:hypothetical protein